MTAAIPQMMDKNWKREKLTVIMKEIAGCESVVTVVYSDDPQAPDGLDSTMHVLTSSPILLGDAVAMLLVCMKMLEASDRDLASGAMVRRLLQEGFVMVTPLDMMETKGNA